MDVQLLFNGCAMDFDLMIDCFLMDAQRSLERFPNQFDLIFNWFSMDTQWIVEGFSIGFQWMLEGLATGDQFSMDVGTIFDCCWMGRPVKTLPTSIEHPLEIKWKPFPHPLNMH